MLLRDLAHTIEAAIDSSERRLARLERAKLLSMAGLAAAIIFIGYWVILG